MATKSIAWNDGSGDYITLTYTGSGNGSIVVSSPENSGAARSKTITVETTSGGLVTKTITVSQNAAPVQVGDVLTYSYTGTVQSVTLPKGQYKLQCWGAQGGSVSGSYTAKGSKGGYSEGVLTISQKTTFYVFVGGKGADISTSTTTSGTVNGGWNGGGGSVRISQNTNQGSYTLGKSYPRGGGGATDIALVTSSMSYSGGVTNRSSASLLSRIIVAGGGGGASANYYEWTEQETQVKYTKTSFTADSLAINYSSKQWVTSSKYNGTIINVSSYRGDTCKFTPGSFGAVIFTFVKVAPSNGASISYATGYGSTGYTDTDATGTSVTIPSDAVYLWVQVNGNDTTGSRKPSKIEISGLVTVTKSSYNVSANRVYGGGTEGGKGVSNYGTAGTQNSGYAFGKGETQSTTIAMFATGAGGGGWYGGGRNTSSQYPNIYVEINGGGSGFVNVAASAGNRPSGYTGLQLDSGETKAGNTSFPKTSGSGNETGHSGDGYAKITRLS